MTDADMPWLTKLCIKRYSNRYDPTTTQQWYINVVLKNPLLFVAERTDNAFAISHLYTMPWTAKELEVDIMFLCADQGAVWEAVTLCRSSIKWAREHNAKKWRVSSETAFELGPIADRLGARLHSQRYIKEL